MKSETSTQKAPLTIFQQTVKYFPTVSINIILRNEKGEFLFVKRKNNPAKGLYWTPGGRLLNGEAMEMAAHRILSQEVGLEGKIVYLSKVYLEEIFSTQEFDAEDWKSYDKDTKTVHYLSTAVLMDLTLSETVELDAQSEAYKWQKELPNSSPYLAAYFELIKAHL